MAIDLQNFFVLGFSYQKSDICVREQLAIASVNQKQFLKEIKVAASLTELVLISTCNRFEIYGYCESSGAEELILNFLKQKTELAELKKLYYLYLAENAYRHLCEVTASIDSMVQGEGQIFGQVKQAYQVACESGTVGRFLHKAFQSTFKLAKKIRTDTSLGHQSLSVAGISVKLIQQIFNDLSKLKVAVIGSGEIAELALINLKSFGCEQITIVNRTIRNAEALAERFDAQAAGLQILPELLDTADVIFGSLKIDRPIFQIKDLKKLKRHRSLVFIDLGLPRNFQSAIREIDDLYLYDISDLESLAANNKVERQDSVKDAELIIENSIYHFKNWIAALKTQPWRCGVREQLHHICEKEAEALFGNKLTNRSLELFSHRLAQKIANLLDDDLLLSKSSNEIDLNQIKILKKELNA